MAKVPVIVVGKINEPPYAEYLVDSGKADGVVIGRALLADPEFVGKAERGETDAIAPCTACAIGCVGEQSNRRHASCVINPALGREKEFCFTKSDTPKKTAVVGGGIGGMAAARAFAMCGHDVTLVEKEEQLGGQMRLACIPPHKQEISRWIIYLEKELEKLPVDIRLGAEADAAMLKDAGYEVIVAATGAEPSLPPVKGIDKEKAVNAWQVLTEEVPVLGGNVLVVGGGIVGCETCEFLVHQARGPLHVTMIEMADAIGAGMVVNNQVPMMKRLAHMGIEMKTGCRLLEVKENAAIVECRGLVTEFNSLTYIIYACGSRPVNKLYEEIKDKFSKVYCIGDAATPRQALEAVREAYEAAMDCR